MLAALAVLAGVFGAGAGAGEASAATVTGRISNLGGGCLENSNNATTVNNPQWLNACGTNVGQQFSRWADGTLRVQGRCLDTLGGATTAGTRVVLVVCSTTSVSQKWSAYTTGFVQNQKSKTCLAPQNNKIAAKVVITIAVCANVNAQKWTLPALSTPDTTTPPVTTTTVPPVTTTVPPATTTVPPVTTTTVPPVTTTVPPVTTTVPPETTTVPPVTTTDPPVTTTTVPPVTTTVPPVTTTTAPPTTTTVPVPTPPQTTQSWDANFTSSGFGRFDDTPWNNVGASAPVIVDSPVTSGAKAARFTMPGGGTRSEIVPTTASFTEGQDRWFRFSFYLPAGFPTQVNTWQVITQWKNDGTGSPPLEITVRDGNLNLSGGYGHPAGSKLFGQALGPATTGQRIDLIVHVLFSRDPNKGVVDIWRNGSQVLAGYKPAGGTLYPTDKKATASVSSYWKMGIYRDSAITLPATYTIEGAKVGNTRTQVQ
ncbi:heparin lyase I family protein [Actinomycetospora atypica]|uniref:Heparin lyase I family protein n=1 Tax=Actinomycetospora atypica TaxID=1290095 RepID=A0ABV9YL78_9PSEU